MNNLKSFLMVSCLVLSYFVSGCMDENQNNTSDDLNDPNIFYVHSQGTKQYRSIQQAIDNVSENFTIFVYAGIYYENIIINKTVILKGENKENTIIDGNYSNDVILIDEGGHVSISGFTIRNSGPFEGTSHDAGIEIKSNNNTIYGNIICNNTNGIYSAYAENNTFKQNIFHSNTGYGMYLHTASDNCIIVGNDVTNNSYGLRIKGSRNNNVSKNLFSDNRRGLYFCCGSRDNIVYHNTFVNNSLWDGKDDVTGNHWDNGYPIGGNYWGNYSGKDEFNGPGQNITGSDGIGDIAHNISDTGDKRDHYPLMEPYIS